MEEGPGSTGALGQRMREASEPRDSVSVQQAFARARAKLLGRPTPVLLSRYVLLEQLGQGGRGVVHKAYDPSLERAVAIKLVRTDIRDESGATSRARLLREAQAIAQLSHPHVVAVFDVGTYDSQQMSTALAGAAGEEGVFVVMEYVPGPTLTSWLKQPRSWQAVQKVMVEAGEGLLAAHQAGLIHRDFKPSNVIVGDDGRVRVLDFGLARATEAIGSRSPDAPAIESDDTTAQLDAAGPDEVADEAITPGSVDPSGGVRLSTPLTRLGTVMGTPVYMAPEQHEGRELGAHADQYAFCLVLFEALYGKRAFAGRDHRELFRKKRAGPPTPPENSSVPDRFAAVVTRGLAVRPEDRFESMRELLAALSIDPLAGRRRMMRWLGAATGLSLVIGGGFAYQQHEAQVCSDHSGALEGVWDDDVRTRARRAFEGTGLAFAEPTFEYVRAELDDYERAWIDARTQTCRDEREGTVSEQRASAITLCLDGRLASLGALTERFGRADDSVVASATDLVHLLPPVTACTEAEPTLSTDAARQSVERGADLLRAEALSLTGDRARARELAQSMVDDTSNEDPLRPRALLILARVSGPRPGVAELDGLYEAWSAAERTGDDRTAVEAALGVVRHGVFERYRLDEARGQVRLLRGLLDRVPADPLFEAQVLAGLAEVHIGLGQPQMAVELSERSVELVRGEVGETHPRLMVPLEMYGRIRFGAGDRTDSSDAFEQSLKITEQTLGPEHPAAVKALIGLSKTHQVDGDLDGALELARRCLRIAEAAHGPEHRDVAECASRIGEVQLVRGNPEDGVRYLERSVEVERHVSGEDSPRLSDSYRELSRGYRSSDRLDDALTAAERGVEIDRKSLPPTHPKLAVDLRVLGEMHHGAEHFESAMRTYEEAAAILDAQDESEKRLRQMAGNLYAAMAEVRLAQGRLDEAVELGETAVSKLEDAGEVDWTKFRAQFALARALWPRDPVRARELAQAARDGYARRVVNPRIIEKIDEWLADHREVKVGG